MPTRPPVHDIGAAAPERRRQYDRTRDEYAPTRSLYKTQRWRALREYYLRSNPLCVSCRGKGLYTAATVCDHVQPHNGDVVRFWTGPFQALCKQCHDSDKQREEHAIFPR